MGYNSDTPPIMYQNHSWQLGSETHVNGPAGMSADANCSFGLSDICTDFFFADTGSSRVTVLNFDTGGGLIRAVAGQGGIQGG